MYTTFADCKQEVAAAINAGAADESMYDLDAIAEECFTWDADDQRYDSTATIDEFWTSVANHDISEG